MRKQNPFALVRAADYTDDQINQMWVEIDPAAIDQIMEPRSPVSKFILGGKGAGKTHILRHFSFPAARLRMPTRTGVEIAKSDGFVAVFLRANGLDGPRFEPPSDNILPWQRIFSGYFELKLLETVLDSLIDLQNSSPDSFFDEGILLRELCSEIADDKFVNVKTMLDLRSWVVSTRKEIDLAANRAAFTGRVEFVVPFALGSLCLGIGGSLRRWCSELADVALIYMIDEIENFSKSQQEVVNTLIRYASGRVTFRVSGRLYSMKTFATVGEGESNREGAEFRTAILDMILRRNPTYARFAGHFIAKRIAASGDLHSLEFANGKTVDAKTYFAESTLDKDFSETVDASLSSPWISAFRSIVDLARDEGAVAQPGSIVDQLVEGFPPLYQKLNILLFCKWHSKGKNSLGVCAKIRSMARRFLEGDKETTRKYGTALSHWKGDLLAQLCRDQSGRLCPMYAGFAGFLQMSCGNPRNLLIVLGKAFELARFRGIDFPGPQPLGVDIQSEAAVEAANFMWESDTNFGAPSEDARVAVSNLATLLRTARYSLNIPEVSPLAVSFSASDLTENARRSLRHALNYSFVFEAQDRPRRNDEGLDVKIQLNPMLSARWALPFAMRGDLALSANLANAIFDVDLHREFKQLLRIASAKWNNPFRSGDISAQGDLFS